MNIISLSSWRSFSITLGVFLDYENVFDYGLKNKVDVDWVARWYFNIV